MGNSKFTFSLGTLLLLMIAGVSIVSHYFTSKRLHQTTTELKQLKLKFGVLEVEDKKLPHFLYVTDSDSPFKWEAYFPEKKPYNIYWGVGTFPPYHGRNKKGETVEGYPKADDLRLSGRVGLTFQGQATLRLQVKEFDAENYLVEVGWENAGSGGIIPKSELPWLDKGNSSSIKIGNNAEIYTAKPDEPFVIYWTRKPTLIPGGGVSATFGPTEGLIIWAEPQDGQ